MSHDRKSFQYCPYCRAEMSTRPVMGRLRQICPACGFIHFLDPKVGAGVLVEQDGAVLLVKRAVVPEKGKWCLPAGFMEYDEDPQTAAVRECQEETGLDVQVVKLLTVDQYWEDTRGPGIVVFYQGCITGGELRPGDDASEAGFFQPDEMPADIAFRTHRHLLARWRDKKLAGINCPDAA